MEDSKIIALYFARNEDAIVQTKDAYGKRLYYLAGRITDNAQDAEECENDTYLRAWDTIPPQRPRSFFAYLARLCRNLALDKLDWHNAAKRKAEIVRLTEEMEQCIPDPLRQSELDDQELGNLLDAFLRTLPEDSKTVFLRRFWFADTVKEIATSMGIQERTVQMRLTRTKAKLKLYLEKEGYRT